MATPNHIAESLHRVPSACSALDQKATGLPACFLSIKTCHLKEAFPWLPYQKYCLSTLIFLVTLQHVLIFHLLLSLQCECHERKLLCSFLLPHTAGLKSSQCILSAPQMLLNKLLFPIHLKCSLYRLVHTRVDY